jgi:DNA (cytosine-5)-methyltransferase 3A
MVGRKLGEHGTRDDSLNVRAIQCLEVHDHGKARCVSTVAKDSLVSNLPAGRYPLISQKGRGNNPGGFRAINGKTPSMTSNAWEHNNHLTDGSAYRKLTTIECERLQTVPENYTAHVSNSQRYKMLGNGWTVDVIAHIFRSMK